MRPPILDVIAAYRAGRTDHPLARLQGRRLDWALESGLGPLLARTCRDDPQAPSLPDWEHVRGADLAARVVAEELAEATLDVIRACAPRVGRIALLKGIWLSHALYPEPHLRPMRDVDLLVAPESVADVERILGELGYEPGAHDDVHDYSRHHHAVPYRHPATGVWIEVHRGLVPPQGPYAQDPAFTRERIRAQLVDAEFRGEPVQRLADDLQLAYLAAHWAGSLKMVSGAGTISLLLDVLGILPDVDWDAVVRGIEGSAAAGALFLLLRYLETRSLLALPPGVQDALRRRQRAFGRANLAMLHALIDWRQADGFDFGGVVRSRRNFEIVWTTLLRPRGPLANLLALPWELVPARWKGAAGEPSAAAAD